MGNIITPYQEEKKRVYKQVQTADGVKLVPWKLTSEHNAKLLPWRVRMILHPEKNAMELFDIYYQVRAKDGYEAAAEAHRFFKEFEKDRFCPDRPFPDTMAETEAEVIDEQDWFSLLKEAKKAKVFLYSGLVENPEAFAYYPDGWLPVWDKYMDLRTFIPFGNV